MQKRAKQKWRQVRGRWNRFWYAAIDPTLVGVIRVITGLMVMYSHAVWGLGLHDYFGAHSWMRPDIVQNLQAEHFHFSYLWFVGDEWLWLAHAVAFLALAGFTLGYKTRLTSVLTVAILVSYARRQPAATFGFDQITAFLTLYLAYGYFATSAAQRALSLDRWLAIRSGKLSATSRPAKSAGANVTLRLIQIQMCVVYFFAGVAKLQGEAWWNGEAMWLAFANEEYANSLSMLWTWRIPGVLAAATHMTVFWELSFAACIWNRTLRPIWLFFGFFMHVGIGLFLSMWTFGLIMIVGCASFTDPDWIGKLLHKRREENLRSKSDDQESLSATEYISDFVVDAPEEQFATFTTETNPEEVPVPVMARQSAEGGVGYAKSFSPTGDKSSTLGTPDQDVDKQIKKPK